MALLQHSASLPGGSGQWNSYNALHHCLGAVGRAVGFLQCTASLPEGSGPCNSCDALPHYLRAVGTVTPRIHNLTA